MINKNNQKSLEVLIVEDTLEYRERAIELLSHDSDVNVKTAASLDSALNLYNGADIIITDIYFPILDVNLKKDALEYLDSVLPSTESVCEGLMQEYAQKLRQIEQNEGRAYLDKGNLPAGLYLGHLSKSEKANRPVIGWSGLNGHGSGSTIVDRYLRRFESSNNKMPDELDDYFGKEHEGLSALVPLALGKSILRFQELGRSINLLRYLHESKDKIYKSGYSHGKDIFRYIGDYAPKRISEGIVFEDFIENDPLFNLSQRKSYSRGLVEGVEKYIEPIKQLSKLMYQELEKLPTSVLINE